MDKIRFFEQVRLPLVKIIIHYHMRDTATPVAENLKVIHPTLKFMRDSPSVIKVEHSQFSVK